MGVFEVSVLGNSGLATFLVVARNREQARELALEEGRDYFNDSKQLQVTRIQELRKPRVLALWDFQSKWVVDVEVIVDG